jgi:hypothetical protein
MLSMPVTFFFASRALRAFRLLVAVAAIFFLFFFGMLTTPCRSPIHLLCPVKRSPDEVDWYYAYHTVMSHQMQYHFSWGVVLLLDSVGIVGLWATDNSTGGRQDAAGKQKMKNEGESSGSDFIPSNPIRAGDRMGKKTEKHKTMLNSRPYI